MKIGYTIAKSPLGENFGGCDRAGVSAVYLGDAENTMIAELREEYPRAPKLRPPRIRSSAGCGKSCSASKANSLDWNSRLTCRRRRSSAVFGRNCSGFRVARRATILASRTVPRQAQGRSGRC